MYTHWYIIRHQSHTDGTVQSRRQNKTKQKKDMNAEVAGKVMDKKRKRQWKKEQSEYNIFMHESIKA